MGMYVIGFRNYVVASCVSYQVYLIKFVTNFVISFKFFESIIPLKGGFKVMI